MPLTEHLTPAGPRAPAHASPDTLQRHSPALDQPVDGYKIHYPTPTTFTVRYRRHDSLSATSCYPLTDRHEAEELRDAILRQSHIADAWVSTLIRHRR